MKAPLRPPPHGHSTTAMHEIEHISPIEYTPPPLIRRCHPYAMNCAPGAEVRLSSGCFVVGCSSPFARTRQAPTTRRFAKPGGKLSMSDLVGENPNVLRPGCVGMRGSVGHTTTAMHDDEYPSPPHDTRPVYYGGAAYFFAPSLGSEVTCFENKRRLRHRCMPWPLYIYQV